MTSASRWLIQLAGDRLREPKFLHVLETDPVVDDEVGADVLEFQADRTRALRFASKQAAERFGLDRLTVSFVAVEVASRDLVELLDHDDELVEQLLI